MKIGLAALMVAFSVSVVAISDAEEPKLTALSPTLSSTPVLTLTCAGGAANATIDLSGGTFSGESASPDANYISAGCKRYVVDVKLPANMNMYFVQGLDGADMNSLDTQAKCESAQTTVLFYRKAAGATSFSAAGGGTTRGVWNSSPGFGQNSCTMKGITGWTARNNTAAGGDTWRVAVGSVEHSLPVRVKVAALVSKVPQ